MTSPFRQALANLLWLARAWEDFWFRPADPTTLGLMRILGGVVILYIHFAYSYDLQDFFGPHAWMDNETANRVRFEAPFTPFPTGWDDYRPAMLLPGDDRKEREQVLDFIRTFPPSGVERDRLFHALEHLPLGEPELSQIPPFLQRLPLHHRLRAAEFIVQLEKESRRDPRLKDKVLDYMLEWTTDPRQVYSMGNWYWSMWFHVTDPFWMIVLHGATLVILALFTVGFCTRIMSVLSWIMVISYIQRSQVSAFGVDTMVNLTLLYLCIGPSGAAFSVDRLLERWRAGIPLKGRPVDPAPPAASVSANVALRLFQINFCLIYFFAGVSKLLGTAWWNGNATYLTMANYEFSPLRFYLYAEFLRFLCQHRWLWEVFMTGGAAFTLGLEISFPYLVWNPRLRWLMLLGAISLHTGIALMMGLTAFSLMMVAMVLAFVPGEVTRSVLARLQRRSGEPSPPIARSQPSDEAPPAALAASHPVQSA